MQPHELLKRLKSLQSSELIDVRSGFEYRSGHIAGAVHAPVWKIMLRVARIPADKNAELVLTCEHGPRAEVAKGLLGAMGYRNVALLDGHMSAWRQAGRPLEK